MKRIFLNFLIFTLLLCGQIYASNLQLDFSQNNQTYNWNNRLEYIYNRDPKFSWEFLFSLNSLLIKKAIQDRWQEDGDLKLKFDYLLKKQFKTGFLLQHKLSSLEERKVTSQDYLLTTEVSFWRRFKLFQNIGVSSISRKSGQRKGEENGLNYSFSLGIGPFIWKRTEFFFDVGQDLVNLEKIPTQQRNLKVRLSRNRSDEDSLDFRYEEGWSKKSFYSGEGAQTNTQKRKERILRLDARRKVFSFLLFKFDYNFRLNNYRYTAEEDTLSDPLSLRDNSLSTQDYTLSLSQDLFRGANLEGFYKYMSGEEDYGLKERNQDLESAELGGKLSCRLSPSDSLFILGSIGVTSFYTSPGSFFNDRDILTKIVHLEYLHIFTPSFDLKVKTGFKNFHQVYISSQKSANNNYNETYILTPSLNWRISTRIRLLQEYSVQANYISYDFQKENESNQNKIFRRASSSTRINFAPHRKLEGDLNYLYQYEDFGQLLWKEEWVMRPGWERKISGVGLSVKYKPLESLVFSSWYNFEVRKDYRLLLDLPTGKEKKINSNKFYRNLLSFSLDYIVDEKNFMKLLWTIRAQKEIDPQVSRDELSNFIVISLGRNL